MTNGMRWGVAAGLAGALALFGSAHAQYGTSSGSTQDPGKETTGTKDPGGTAGAAGSTAGSTSAEAGSRHAASGQAMVDKKLQEQFQTIHASNRAEIHMAQMGQQQATSPQVKQFAQQLEQDHQQLDKRLTQAAQTAGIALEGKEAEKVQQDADKHMKKLQGKTGHEFDKEFVSMMVDDHEKDIKEVQKASKEAKKQNQAELASVLDRAATGMQGHLTTAKQLEETVKKGGTQSRGASGASTGSGSTGAGSTGAGSSGSGATGQGQTGSPSTGAGKDDTTGNNPSATEPKEKEK